MKFKEDAIKPGMVIHCPKEADRLATRRWHFIYAGHLTGYWLHTESRIFAWIAVRNVKTRRLRRMQKMTVDHIELCVCADHEPTGADSVYYGMPILMPTDSWDTHKSFWEIKCPKCGRGGMYQFKSPYYALKWWNELQKRLKNPINPITGAKE